MSKKDLTGNTSEPKPPRPRAGRTEGKWGRRARRIRDEAGLHLVRGAATTAGGIVVTCGALWLQAR